MTTIVGGLRSRFVHDSLKNMIEDSLDSLGWFDPGRRHDSVTVRSDPLDAEEEALPNIVALDLFDSNSSMVEMGNAVLTLDTYYYAVDVYAENNSLGLHLSGDVLDIIRGKFSSIGRTGPTLDVLDLSLATPASFATLDFDTVTREKSRFYQKPYQKHWWQIFVTMEDAYGDEAD